MERFPITFREVTQAVVKLTEFAQNSEPLKAAEHTRQIGLWKALEDRILSGEQIFERPDDQL